MGLHPDLFRYKDNSVYINNNPGASMLGAIPYFVARPIISAVFWWKPTLLRVKPPARYDDPRPNRTRFMNEARNRGVDIKLGLAAASMHVGLMAPLGATAAVAVFFFLRARLANESRALWLALLYAFGTPIFFRSAFLNQNAILTHCVLFAYLALAWVVFDQEVLPRPEQWVGLVVVSLLTTPLQAAGEEVAFRGGLVQSVGSWFRSPLVALVVTTTLSAGLFAAAHGSADPWVILELGSLAVYGCYLAWRTGGLEAVLVIHVVNNLLITVSGALLGGLEESYVDQSTTGSPVSAGLSILVTGFVTALLLRGARRRGIAATGWLTPALG